MNIFLFSKDEKDSDGNFSITGDSFRHLTKVLKKDVGDTIYSGEIDGLMGHSKITSLSSDCVKIKPNHIEPPPSPLPVSLILALPRPKMFKRILRSVSMLGVKKNLLN